MLTKGELRHIDYPRWEVLVLVYDSADEAEEDLAALGAEGWEPISCGPMFDHHTSWHATVKRRIKPTAEEKS